MSEKFATLPPWFTEQNVRWPHDLQNLYAGVLASKSQPNTILETLKHVHVTNLCLCTGDSLPQCIDILPTSVCLDHMHDMERNVQNGYIKIEHLRTSCHCCCCKPLMANALAMSPVTVYVKFHTMWYRTYMVNAMLSFETLWREKCFRDLKISNIVLVILIPHCCEFLLPKAQITSDWLTKVRQCMAVDVGDVQHGCWKVQCSDLENDTLLEITQVLPSEPSLWETGFQVLCKWDMCMTAFR